MSASISGFTFIRNGVELAFPFEASIRSLLPLVDEFVVAVGKGSDDTLARVFAPLATPRSESSKPCGMNAWLTAVLSTPSKR